MIMMMKMKAVGESLETRRRVEGWSFSFCLGFFGRVFTVRHSR